MTPSKPAGPAHGAATPPSACCPHCGRFRGPVARCPFCQTRAPRPLLLRLLRIGSVLLAVIGLATLHLAMARRELPAVRIDQITPMMNYAYVRVVGTVTRSPYLSRREGTADYLSFLVDDGSGAIRVVVQGETARMLEREERIPARGTRVDVAGSLQVRHDGTVRLRLQSERQLRVADPAPGEAES